MFNIITLDNSANTVSISFIIIIIIILQLKKMLNTTSSVYIFS